MHPEDDRAACRITERLSDEMQITEYAGAAGFGGSFAPVRLPFIDNPIDRRYNSYIVYRGGFCHDDRREDA